MDSDPGRYQAKSSLEHIQYYTARALENVDSFCPVILLLRVFPNKIILDI